MSKYNEQFLKEIGLDQLDADRKDEIMEKLDEIFQKFLTLELANLLDEEDIKKTEALTSAEELESFLEEKKIDYKSIARSVALNIKQFIRENMLYLQGYIDSTLDNSN